MHPKAELCIFMGKTDPSAAKHRVRFYLIFLVQVEDGTIAKITEHKIEHDSTTDYIDEHIYDVTCLAEGTTEVAFNIGNSKTGSEQ